MEKQCLPIKEILKIFEEERILTQFFLITDIDDHYQNACYEVPMGVALYIRPEDSFAYEANLSGNCLVKVFVQFGANRLPLIADLYSKLNQWQDSKIYKINAECLLKPGSKIIFPKGIKHFRLSCTRYMLRA